MHYADARALADRGLTIRPHVEDGVREHAGFCVECGERQAPPGIDSRHELARWAHERAEHAPPEPLNAADRAIQFPKSRHTACAVCNAQLVATIGIPVVVLDEFLRGLDQSRPSEYMRGVLQYRLVFLFCQNCAANDRELYVAVDKIHARYRLVREAQQRASFDVTPSQADAMVDAVFARLAAIIAARQHTA